MEPEVGVDFLEDLGVDAPLLDGPRRPGLLVEVAGLGQRRGERQRFLELAGRCGASVAIVHCHATQAVLQHRVAERSIARIDASEAGLDVLARQPGYWEPFDPGELDHVVDVDTSNAAAVERGITQLIARAGR